MTRKLHRPNAWKGLFRAQSQNDIELEKYELQLMLDFMGRHIYQLVNYCPELFAEEKKVTRFGMLVTAGVAALTTDLDSLTDPTTNERGHVVTSFIYGDNRYTVIIDPFNETVGITGP